MQSSTLKPKTGHRRRVTQWPSSIRRKCHLTLELETMAGSLPSPEPHTLAAWFPVRLNRAERHVLCH